MGLEPIERDEPRRRGLVPAGRAAAASGGGRDAPAAVEAPFAVEVRDLAEARRSAAEHGAEIDQEEAGRFWMRDPSGNRIEVVQAP
jgi:hypothetical protein